MARQVMNLDGHEWQFERMRPGEGEKQGITDWECEISGATFSWDAANVPGDVFTDLANVGAIEDPFYGRNMEKVKWVMDYEWWYAKRIMVPDEFKGKRLTLKLGGVDYSCKIFLNKICLGTHEGMFSPMEYDVTDLIEFDPEDVPVYTELTHFVQPRNLLMVRIDPAPRNQKAFAGLRYNSQGDYLTGIVPLGIWKSVELIATEKVYIENYVAETKLMGEDARVSVEVNVKNLEDVPFNARVKAIIKEGENRYEAYVDSNLKNGKNRCSFTIDIPNAKLWWPWDLGDQFMYDIEIVVEEDGVILDNLESKVGLREVTMAMNPGFTKEEVENPWTWVINGKSYFLRSACWGGPPSFFYGRNSADRYRHFISLAKEANLNNLRMFGWHPPEDEDFYKICDELGVTVWTNFPFTTQRFSEDRDYVERVLQECEQIVIDRRNHPSNIFWMGGEEVYFTRAHVDSGNKILMQRIGARIKNVTTVPYGDASPLSQGMGLEMGYKTKESSHANAHFYEAGEKFMEEYYPEQDFAIIPEFCAASPPSVESLKKFIPEDELWPMGPSWGYHQINLKFLEALNLEVHGSKMNSSLEEFVEATQITQGVTYQYVIEHFRRRKPRTSCVALCHWITNWPIIKWEVIDYYGEKKLSFDYVKKCEQPLLPSIQYDKRRWLPGEDFEGKLWIINDYHKEFKNSILSWRIENSKGDVVDKGDVKVDIGENISELITTCTWKVEGELKDYFNVYTSITSAEGEVLAQNDCKLLIDDMVEIKRQGEILHQENIEINKKYGIYNLYRDLECGGSRIE